MMIDVGLPGCGERHRGPISLIRLCLTAQGMLDKMVTQADLTVKTHFQDVPGHNVSYY